MTPTDIDEELPPWLGERLRDTIHDIHFAAVEADQETDNDD